MSNALFLLDAARAPATKVHVETGMRCAATSPGSGFFGNGGKAPNRPDGNVEPIRQFVQNRGTGIPSCILADS